MAAAQRPPVPPRVVRAALHERPDVVGLQALRRGAPRAVDDGLAPATGEREDDLAERGGLRATAPAWGPSHPPDVGMVVGAVGARTERPAPQAGPQGH